MCSTSLTSLLPQELFDQIIDDNGLDNSTLLSCSLVCRSFVRPSQARIFSHLDCVTVATDRDSAVAHFRRLHDILTESPHLVRYITNLSFRVGFESFPCELVSILHLLSNIRSIDFNLISWPDLPPEARTAICDLCQRSKLSYIGLRGVEGISAEGLALIVDTPFLTYLCLEDVELSTPKDIAHWPLHNRMQLFDLVLDGDDGIDIDMTISWLVEGRCLSDLRRLSVTCDISSLQRLIDVSAPSLEDVTLSSTFECMCCAQMFSLGSTEICLVSRPLSLAAATALRSISVTFTIRADSFLPWLVELLQSHNSPRTLHTIVLNIFSSRTTVPTDWNKLARLLEGDRFPALRTVEFICRGYNSSPLLPATMTATPAAFARLAARGVFKCSKRT